MGELAFQNPALVLGGLAIAVPVAIHLLSRRRSRRLAFAAVDFILRAKKEKVHHIKLKQLLLLLLRALVVLCVGLAIARPLLRPKAAAQVLGNQAAATALVLDGSFSMRYRLGGQTLFERAQSDAQTLVDKLSRQSPATLVVCDGRPPVATRLDFDRVALQHRIRGARPTYRPADVSACIAVAAHALQASPLEAKRIYVLSDLAVPSIHLDEPAPMISTPKGPVLAQVVFIDSARGHELPNLAVTEVKVTPSAELGTRGFDVAATISNSGDRPATGISVALLVGGHILTRGFVDVPAHASARKVLRNRFEPGTDLGEVVLGHDALIPDDSRAFVVNVPRDVNALVVDGAPNDVRYRDEAFFVDAALGPGHTGGRIHATFLDADAAQALDLSDFDVVLLLNVATPRSAFVASLRSFVENGGGLFISAGDQVDPDEYNGAFGDLLPRAMHLVRTAADPSEPDGPPPARFADIDVTAPAFRVFAGATEGFDSTSVYKYVQLQPDARGKERVLASFDDGSPAIIEAQRGRGRVVLYTSTVDAGWTDWPLHTTFLPAIQQLTEYLGGALAKKPPVPSTVGAVRKLDLPSGTRLVELKGPDGRAVQVSSSGVRVDEPGFYTATVSESGSVRDAPELAFAAVLDPVASDTRRLDPKELAAHFGGAGHSSVAGGVEGALPKTGTPLWTYLLVAALAAFIGEGVLVRNG